MLAGLSTTLGAGAVLLLPSHRVSRTLMAFALALAAGVMISVTVLEFWLPMLGGGKHAGPVLLWSAVGAGAFLILSYFVPDPEYVDGEGHPPHDCPSDAAEAGQNSPPVSTIGKAVSEAVEEEDDDEKGAEEGERRRRCRLAMVLMMALTAHNFPEGLAVALSALHSDRLGAVVMIAIALHNIPEGISIALPVLAATGSKTRALWLSFLSGMAEPLGAVTALVAVHILGGHHGEESMEGVLCTVGGVMMAVALKELLPEALRQGRPGAAAVGLAIGALVMWVTSHLGA